MSDQKGCYFDTEIAGQELRTRAEEIQKEPDSHFAEVVEQMTKTDMLAMAHKLHEHQVELEIRNEELRQTQNELQAVREYYADLYNFAPVGYCTVSEVGLILEANLTAAMLLGVPQQEIAQQSFFNFINKEDRDIFYNISKGLPRIGESHKYELRLIKKDGTQFWASIIAMTALNLDGLSEIRIIIIDISEPRKTQGELRVKSAALNDPKENLKESSAVLFKSAEQLSAFVQHASISIAIFDLEMNYLAANDGWVRNYGGGKQCIIGLNHYVLNPDFPAEWKHLYQLAFAGATFKNQEEQWVRPDGSVEWVRWTLQPWLNEHSAIGGIIIYAEDITVRKIKESQLLQSEKQLRGLIAHQRHIKEAERIHVAREIHDELGSVLTGIKAHLSVAIHEDETAGVPPNRNLRQASVLLDLAVDTVRKIITELRPSVLDQLGVWAALEWYAEQIQARFGLRCNVSISRKIQKINVDTERSTAIFRILQEALTNVTRHANASMVEIRVTLVGDLVRLEIEDDGKGIGTQCKQEPNSWGIAGMVERARFLGGNIRIIDIGHGTLVTLQLPLEKKGD